MLSYVSAYSCFLSFPCNFSRFRWTVKMEMGIQGWCWQFATRSSSLLTSFWQGDTLGIFSDMILLNFNFFYELFVIISLFYFSTNKWWPSRFTPCFHHRKDVDVNLSNKAGLTALHLACQAGDTLLVCILHPKKEANSKELSSFCCKTDALPNEIISNNQ